MTGFEFPAETDRREYERKIRKITRQYVEALEQVRAEKAEVTRLTKENGNLRELLKLHGISTTHMRRLSYKKKGKQVAKEFKPAPQSDPRPDGDHPIACICPRCASPAGLQRLFGKPEAAAPKESEKAQPVKFYQKDDHGSVYIPKDKVD